MLACMFFGSVQLFTRELKKLLLKRHLYSGFFFWTLPTLLTLLASLTLFSSSFCRHCHHHCWSIVLFVIFRYFFSNYLHFLKWQILFSVSIGEKIIIFHIWDLNQIHQFSSIPTPQKQNFQYVLHLTPVHTQTHTHTLSHLNFYNFYRLSRHFLNHSAVILFKGPRSAVEPLFCSESDISDFSTFRRKWRRPWHRKREKIRGRERMNEKEIFFVFDLIQCKFWVRNNDL